MRPDDWAALKIALMAFLAVLWLAWVLLPSLQPAVALLVALWLILAAWLSVKG